LLEAVRGVTREQEGTVMLLQRFLAPRPGLERELLSFLEAEAEARGQLVAVEGALDWIISLCAPDAPGAGLAEPAQS